MIVTQVEQHNSGKYKIYIDNDFAFVLYKGELVKYGIKVDKELPDEIYNEIFCNVLVKRAKLYAMNILTKMDKTEADLRKKLKQALYPEEVINNAIEYVKSFHYIDDVRYSAAYLNMSICRMSRKEIENKLLQKGVSKVDICRAFDEYEESENDTIEDRECELVKKLINKKCHGNQPSSEDKMRLFASIYRKGFSSALIEKAYREVFKSI